MRKRKNMTKLNALVVLLAMTCTMCIISTILSIEAITSVYDMEIASEENLYGVSEYTERVKETSYIPQQDTSTPDQTQVTEPRWKSMSVTATAYCPCVECCGEWSDEHPSRVGTDYEQLTASGTVPTAGRTIAVDPEVIPLGSYVLVGNQVYIAEDVGGAVTGNHIDIFFNTHEEALEWGVQTLEVKVFEKQAS